jgi:tetratricopeptide (TPR) repeat protein
LIHKAFQGFRTHANNAHNEILEYWSQIGTLGFGVVILFWIVFFRLGSSIAARLPMPWKGLEWGLIAGVAGMLVDNLLNVSAHFAVPALLFWWCIASVVALDPACLQMRRIELRGTWQSAVLVLAGAALVISIGRSGCLWEQEVNYYNGFKLTKNSADALLAEKYLKKAYAFHQLEVNNNYELANLYAARLGDKERAIRFYQRALDANAGYDEIYYNYATILAQLGRSTEAIRDYQITLEINPLSRIAYNALGSLYMGDLPRYGEAAEALFQKGLAFFPNDKDLWNNLGYVEIQRGRWNEAYEAYRRALAIDPQFDVARRNLALVAAKLRRPPKLLE